METFTAMKRIPTAAQRRQAVQGQRPAAAVQGTMAALRQTPAAAAPGDRVPQGQSPSPVKPTLLKMFGIEVLPTQGGVKVTGVMGNSWGSRGGFEPGDIVIQCNGAKPQNLQQLQAAINKSPPEGNAQIKVLRNGRTRDLSVIVGEGEMHAFTAMKRTPPAAAPGARR